MTEKRVNMEQRRQTIPAVVMAVQLAVDIILEVSSEEESSSSEEELIVLNIVRKKRTPTWYGRRRQPVRIQNYVNHVVRNYSAAEFQSHFRITREAYEALLRRIGPDLQRQAETGRNTINVEKQLLAVIWLLATPDSYRSVGERFNMGKSSLSVAFVRVVNSLNRIAQAIIQWPAPEQMIRIERAFRRLSNVPNVIGAIDGTFIPIKAPKEHPDSYITRKCNFAITLQAICEPSLKYTDVFVGYPGSVSDTRIFRNSDIYQKVEHTEAFYFPNNTHIIGDKAYPPLSWCIPPYIDHGHMTPQKNHFNRCIASTRQVVERSFALLFGRFRRLKYLDMNRTDLVPATVLAACVLHNLCLNFDDLNIEAFIRKGLNHVYANDDVEDPRNAPENIEAGRNKRDHLCAVLYNNVNVRY